MNKVWGSIRFSIRMAFRVDPRLASAALMLEPVALALGPLGSFWIREMVDAATASAPSSMLIAAAGLTASNVLAMTFVALGFRVRTKLRERTGAAVDRWLIGLSCGVDDIEHLERPDFLNRMDLLREQSGGLAATLNGLVPAIGSALRLCVVAVMLALVDIRLIVLPLFTVPLLIAGATGQRSVQAAQESATERLRFTKHLFSIATGVQAAKDVRAMGIGGALLSRHIEASEAVERVEARARLRNALLLTLGWFLFAAAYSVATIAVASRALRGQASPGDLLLTVMLGAQLNQIVGEVSASAQWLLRTSRSGEHALWLSGYAEDKKSERRSLPVYESIGLGIRLQNVKFRYPGTDRWVLDIDLLDLPAGSTVAIVGDNGAGKTTLVKLLSGLYKPSTGRVLVDMVDVADLDLEAWRERVACVFQDFVRFEFLAGETIGIGSLPWSDDEMAIHAALNRAGGADLTAAFPSGLATQLGRRFTGGIDLSTGQWQKLALARASMRPSPLLVILDEPTASLDAQTEYDLYLRYAEQSRIQHNGRITVLVSHRLASVRHAESIVVLRDGRVVERGTHDQLVNARGEYAQLYATQSAAYQ